MIDQSVTFTGRNDAVTLIDDPVFLGYVFGKLVAADGADTGQLMVSISKPGASGLRGCVPIARERLVLKS